FYAKLTRGNTILRKKETLQRTCCKSKQLDAVVKKIQYTTVLLIIIVETFDMNKPMRLSFLIGATAASLFWSVGAYAQEVITIQQAIDKTLQNNLQVKQAQLSESLNDVNLTQSKAALYPSLNANVNQNLGWGRNQVASGLFQNTQNYN